MLSTSVGNPDQVRRFRQVDVVCRDYFLEDVLHNECRRCEHILLRTFPNFCTRLNSLGHARICGMSVPTQRRSVDVTELLDVSITFCGFVSDTALPVCATTITALETIKTISINIIYITSNHS
ncbi:hypothetical protein DPMN_072378 [Dreissena polymorpha]|uniref:Uncharacterized protein n=1 Tax=Dreissena polymorpha TaxID=45954 RepID=A0A9D3Z841_DREPO|nr:hypothetical protein DPMN_072378 [Dreissena polymorpha]